jgi:prepilin-type processing-associated H-X9-DG protein
LDEAWDSPDNQALLEEMPEVFRSDLPGVETWQTVYQAVAGPQQIFNGRLTSFADIKDGTSGTAMLVETNAESVAVWTSPYDSRIQREDPFVELRREGVLGFNVLMADGSVRTISFGVSNEDWWGATTMAGGEVVNIGDDE